jgi:hypothetical protein
MTERHWLVCLILHSFFWYQWTVRAARVAPLATPVANHGSIDDDSCCTETVLGERLQRQLLRENDFWKETAMAVAARKRFLERGYKFCSRT